MEVLGILEFFFFSFFFWLISSDSCHKNRLLESLNTPLTDQKLSHICLCVFDLLGNEWKTRFETQEELNQLLQKQIDLLKDKLDKAKESAKGGYEEDMKTYDELSEVGTYVWHHIS